MYKAIVVGLLWGVGIQALVWPPAYVFQAPKHVYWVMGGFLWWAVPPLRSNDAWVFGQRSRG